MNDVEELRRYMLLHARVQGMTPAAYHSVADRATSDDPDDPTSWTAVWSEHAETRDDPLDACRAYNLARFPFVDGPARRKALHDCVAAFDRWRGGHTTIEPLTVDCGTGLAHCWTIGLDGPTRPLVLVMGGQVSIKEQWAPLLPMLHERGFAGVAAEMPGVGENTVPYTPDSWRMISAILDTAGARECYAICLSFGGHLALRAAAHDDRIRGIVTAGAPVRRFFTDPGWLAGVPRLATDSIAHLIGTTDPATLADFALGDKVLDAVTVPVHYLRSARDEIVPYDEADTLRAHVRELHVLDNDDAHGSPRHVTATRLWVVRSLLRMSGTGPVRDALLSGLLGIARAVARLRNRTGDRSHNSSVPAARPRGSRATPPKGISRHGD